MRPGRWQKFSIILAFWLVFGSLSGLLVYFQYSNGPKPMTLGKSLYLELSFALINIAFGPLILWMAHHFRIDRHVWIRNIGIHLTVACLISIVEKFLWDLLIFSPESYLQKDFTYGKLFKSISGTLDTGVIVYFLFLLVDYAIDYYRRYQTGLVEAARLQTQLVQAQLQALKMQLHPHFLFNTLNTISALVHEDPEGAERTIAQLSDLLRLSLESTGLQEVPLRQELEFLQLYLNIEKTRFEERLAVDFEIEDQANPAMVPSLILQPIVENSIRHGLANRTSGGHISIRAERQGDSLALSVKDNGCGLPPDRGQRRNGLGLATTRARLARLYGNNHSLVLRNVAGGGVEVRIVLPHRIAIPASIAKGAYGQN